VTDAPGEGGPGAPAEAPAPPPGVPERRGAPTDRRALSPWTFFVRPNDRWAHRKGEPRTLVLLWTMFLMASAAVTVFSVGVLGMPQRQQFQPASRAMFAMAAIGLTVLWPMIRLSQSAPERPLRAVWLDMGALVLPAQAIVWPTRMLTGWSWSVLAGCACAQAAWTLFVGALLALGLRGCRAGGTGARTGWMGAVLLAVGGAPALQLLGGLLGFTPREAGWLASPLTISHALTTSPSGLSPAMEAHEWLAIGAPAAAGLILWAALHLAAPRGRG
jgi:hypothetical protein